jgi:hypothetical protein
MNLFVWRFIRLTTGTELRFKLVLLTVVGFDGEVGERGLEGGGWRYTEQHNYTIETVPVCTTKAFKH